MSDTVIHLHIGGSIWVLLNAVMKHMSLAATNGPEFALSWLVHVPLSNWRIVRCMQQFLHTIVPVLTMVVSWRT